jgi:ribonuclease D
MSKTDDMFLQNALDDIAQSIRELEERQNAIVNALREWRDKTATLMDIPPIDVLDLPDGSL